MLEDKKLKEAENRVKQYIRDDIIKTKGKPENVKFFLKNADDSIDSAKALFELSTDPKKQQFFGFTSFNGLLWVVNASYYSMFYMARALLESIGIKIKTDESLHFIVFNAIIYYFYSTGKLERCFIEDFKNAGEESFEILGKEKAKEIISDYSNEKEKRAKFTYEIGEIAMKNKAETSLSRAKRFNEEVRKILMK